MVSLKDARISTKLTLLCVATSAVALMCVVVAFFIQDYRLVKRVKAEQVHAQITMLTENIRQAVNDNDRDAIPAVIRGALTEHGIVAATVESPAGQLLTAEVDVQALQQRYSGWVFSVRKIVSPLRFDNQASGTLVTYIGYSDVEARLLYLLGYSILAFALAIFIAYVVAHKVQKWVSKPLLRLSKLSQQVVQSGNYAVRSNIVSDDEIGRLSAAFNQMLQHIESRDQMLEKQVHRRTRELRKLAEDFRYRALHDSLTGLPNRALLLEEFNRAVSHANRVGKFFGVLLLDLDNFKTINDTLGHEAGDALLRKAATIIRTTLRGEDTVCRLGGDEFVVLLEDVESEQSLQSVGGSLHSALNRDIQLNGRPVRIGVSIGASIYPEHGATLEELKHHADIALYQAKAAGKNQLVVFNSELASKAHHKLILQRELKAAVEANKLELHFQPQIDTRLKVVVGCEAFLRWHHPSLGVMQPVDFLGHAEEAGLIRQIDHFVINEACRRCREWRVIYDVHLPVSINISASLLRSAGLVDKIVLALEEYELPPHFLTLELHEEMLASKNKASAEVIQRLRRLGVRFALGDFGVGYVPLNHWRDSNFDLAYLHRGVTGHIGDDPKSRNYIGALMRFADELNVSIIAQGVEDRVQLKALEALGCHKMQGHLFASPLPNEQFLTWLNNLSDLQIASQPQRHLGDANPVQQDISGDGQDAGTERPNE